MADFEIRYTFGIDPLQQYLIELPGGRLQPLTIAWDTNRKRWFHLYPHEKAPPGDVMHWTGHYQTGNTMCIECHTTGYEKRYDAQGRPLRLALDGAQRELPVLPRRGRRRTWPGRRRSRRAAAASAAPHRRRANFGLHGRPQGCAASRREGRARGLRRLPFAAQRPHADADGRRAAARQLPAGAPGRRRCTTPTGSSATRSTPTGRSARARCTSSACAAPTATTRTRASSRPKATASACNATRRTPNPRFPTAAGNFDSPAHHFHKPGTPGAQCVQLPHADHELHDRARAARPQHARARGPT